MLSVFFYLFSIIAVLSAIMVIIAKNPVHSVFFLILTFFNATGLFILMGAEFLAMLLLVVYVGAVAVLFLFVIMMLDFNIENIKKETRKYLPLGLFIGAILFLEITLMIYTPEIFSNEFKIIGKSYTGNQSNTEILGNLIYTDYFLQFQLAGFILLVAMIGAIVLTLRHRDYVRRQNISNQINRDSKSSIELVNIKLNDRDKK